MVKLIPVTALILFFLILAERVTWEAVLIGFAVSLLALKANERKAEESSPRLYSIKLWPYWIMFILVLIREIIFSNIQVAIIVCSRNMPIQPNIYPYHTRIKDRRLAVVLSNSITLTPGTMTVDLHGSELTIHALTEQHYKNLAANPVEGILLRMEEKLYG